MPKGWEWGLGLGVAAHCAWLVGCSPQSVTTFTEDWMVASPVEDVTPVSGDEAHSFLADPPRQPFSWVLHDEEEDQENELLEEREARTLSLLRRRGSLYFVASRVGGLTVVDTEAVTAPTILDSVRVSGRPVFLQVDDDLVVVVYDQVPVKECPEGRLCIGQFQSLVQVIDASEPSQLRVVSEMRWSGEVVDAAISGSRLHVVSQEPAERSDTDCWAVSGPVIVRTVDFADVAAARAIGQWTLDLPPCEHSQFLTGWRHEATDSLYLAVGLTAQGPEEARATDSSRIYSLDLSSSDAPSLVDSKVLPYPIAEKASLDLVAGGLRFANGYDRLETFRTEPSGALDPLGSLVLPDEEGYSSRWSVHWDGERAVAVEDSYNARMVLLDLSEPSEPVVASELQFPGMDVDFRFRGNRLLTLSSSSLWSSGPSELSLFDVTDWGQPRQLSSLELTRQVVGSVGGYSEMRRHWSVDWDASRLVLQFTEASDLAARCTEGEIRHRVHRVDFEDGALSAQGSVARGGFGPAQAVEFRDSQIVALTADSLVSFDFAIPEDPAVVANLLLRRHRTQLQRIGDGMVRFGYDAGQAARRAHVDWVPLESAGVVAGQRLDFSLGSEPAESVCRTTRSLPALAYSDGPYVYLPTRIQDYPTFGPTEYRPSFELQTFALNSAEEGAVLRSSIRGAALGETHTWLGSALKTERALLVPRFTGYYDENGSSNDRAYAYDIFDLSQPANPRWVTYYEVAEELVSGGWGSGFAGSAHPSIPIKPALFPTAAGPLVSGHWVVGHHIEAANDHPGRVRYYLDRMDVQDPSTPQFLPPIEIPGEVIHFDADTGQLVTLHWRGQSMMLSSLLVEGEQATRLSQLAIPEDTTARKFAISEDRIFFVTVTIDPTSPLANRRETVWLESLRLDNGQMHRLPSTVVGHSSWVSYDLLARGHRALIRWDNAALTVVDTENPNEPKVLTQYMGYGDCVAVEASEQAAYCAGGLRGVEVIDLTPLSSSQ